MSDYRVLTSGHRVCNECARHVSYEPHHSECRTAHREENVRRGPVTPRCPLPTYRCACKGDWCRLLQRNLT